MFGFLKKIVSAIKPVAKTVVKVAAAVAVAVVATPVAMAVGAGVASTLAGGSMVAGVLGGAIDAGTVLATAGVAGYKKLSKHKAKKMSKKRARNLARKPKITTKEIDINNVPKEFRETLDLSH